MIYIDTVFKASACRMTFYHQDKFKDLSDVTRWFAKYLQNKDIKGITGLWSRGAFCYGQKFDVFSFANCTKTMFEEKLIPTPKEDDKELDKLIFKMKEFLSDEWRFIV